MSADDFAQIADALTTKAATNSYIEGRTSD
jgi:hypothetical protein